MTRQPKEAPGDAGGVQRIRLSEWARRQGISRLTAYRMLQAGTLPVPAERTPTGRWFVLVATESRVAVYARASDEPDDPHKPLDSQISSLVRWASYRNMPIYTVIREVGDPEREPLPLLAKLLGDGNITQILIETPEVVGTASFALLNAALAPHGRAIVARNPPPG